MKSGDMPPPKLSLADFEDFEFIETLTVGGVKIDT